MLPMASTEIEHPARPATTNERVAAFAITVGQCNATHPAFLRGTDFCQVHERLPEPLTVNVEFFHGMGCIA